MTTPDGAAIDAPAADGTATDAAVPSAVLELSTSQGPARAEVWAPARPVGTLVASHGSGAGRRGADLDALVALAAGDRPWRIVLVDQPWKVAGRRIAPAPARLDEAWREIVPALRAAGEVGASGEAPDGSPDGPPGGPLVLGGRSAGARVACRTSRELGADAVLALAFPLHPPGRPEKSRAAELLGAGLPTLVVQGASDPFGGPEEIRAVVGEEPIRLVAARGAHAFAGDAGDVRAAVRAWLDEVVAPR